MAVLTAFIPRYYILCIIIQARFITEAVERSGEFQVCGMGMHAHGLQCFRGRLEVSQFSAVACLYYNMI